MTVALPPPYPLQWPDGKQRTLASKRIKAAYSISTVPAAIEELDAEMRRCAIRQFQITCTYTGRGGGIREVTDPGASLWFIAPQTDITLPQQLMSMACDRYLSVAHNLRGLSLTMQRLRLVDEIGAYSFMLAVEGARALPPPARPWWQVLQVDQGASPDVVEAVYRALAKIRHPDAGGTAAQWAELEQAIVSARAARGRP